MDVRATLINRLAIAGPVLLLVVASIWGVLEVHSSTDTWIGLAAGKQIVELGHVPLNDTFSFTFQGQPWYNQNWLSHLYLYWLYSSFGPDWVIYGTWLVGFGIFGMTLGACRLRSGSWTGAILAAAIVAFGCRDFISARPATVQFFCVATFWFLVCALESQGERRRWWPIAALLPLIMVWGNAHGSFVFAYAALALYLGHWALFSIGLPRIGAASAARWVAIDMRQAVAIAVLLVACFVLTVLTGPFGIHNFIHPEKVAGSSVWRQVGEWHPPYTVFYPLFSSAPVFNAFPPVQRFWGILALVIVVLSIATAAGTMMRLSVVDIGPRRRASVDSTPARVLFWSWYDVAMIGVGLWMTIFARRFAPMFYILGAPLLLTWVLLLTRHLDDRFRSLARVAAGFVAAPLAAALAWLTWTTADAELIQQFKTRMPNANLLERVTRYDSVPHEAILFLRDNELEVNLLVEWTNGGPVMLFAPKAKLFMDGRAQQVYDEATYMIYQRIMQPDSPPNDQRRMQLLAGFDLKNEPMKSPPIDAVMIRINSNTQNLAQALEGSGQWVVAYLKYGSAGVLLKVGSKGMLQLQEKLRAGTAKFPDSAEGRATEGNIWLSMQPPDFERGWAAHKAAVDMSPRMGLVSYGPIYNSLRRMNREGEALEYLKQQRERLSKPIEGLDEAERKQVSDVLGMILRQVQPRGGNAGSGAAATQPRTP